MPRGKIMIAVVVLLGVLCAGGAGVYWSLKHVPDFYQQALAEKVDPVVRKAAAKKFVQTTLRLVDRIQHEDAWSEEFRQAQINSWLAEELHQKYEEVVPPGVTEPRVQITEGSVLIGFRYEDENFQGVVSVRLRPWVPEPNRLAIEVESVKAGVVPIPLQDVIDEVTDTFKTEGWHVEWQQADGNDVLIVHLDSGGIEDQPTLERIDVVEGAVRIFGRRSSSSTGTDSPMRMSVLPSHSEAE
jgi:hypothetical protein